MIFFRRGTGPLVSAMIPSRGRPERLEKALWSLLTTSKDVDCIEILVAADDDDPATIDVGKPYGKVVTSPRGNGYADMHLRINAMAKDATGDWLMLLNDDVEMVTQGWDERLLNTAAYPPWFGVDDVCHFSLEVEGGDPLDYGFPVVRRKAVEILGRYSPYALADTWAHSLYGCIGASVRGCGIRVKHHKREDQTFLEGADARRTMDREVRSSRFRHNLIFEASRLLAMMDGDRLERVWSDVPEESGWY